MKISPRIAASMLALSVCAPVLASDIPWHPVSSSLFSNVSGSLYFSDVATTPSMSFGPSEFGSPAKATFHLDSVAQVKVRGTDFYETRIVGTESATSNANSQLEILGHFDRSFPTSIKASWTATLTNPFSDTRSFYLGAATRSTGMPSSASLSANGVELEAKTSDEIFYPDAPCTGICFPYAVYSIGELAAGDSATISLSLTGSLTAYSTGASTEILSFATQPVSPVPEPATTAMMLAGLGVLAAVGRKRARATRNALTD